MGTLRDDFAALVAAGDRADLAHAALAIARIGHPGLDPRPSLRRLDALAAAVRPRLTPGIAPVAATALLTSYLFGECGFRGNDADYYDPRNSFLNDVLDRRTGIPISLAVVVLEIGRRLGLPITGVGFPGHFLVCIPGRGGRVFLDPFFGGRPIGERELVARYRALRGEGGKDAELPPDALDTTGTIGILTRMLRNLLRVYLEREDHAQALASVELILVLLPESPDEMRVRGLLYEHLECFAAALADFRQYVALAPDAADAAHIRDRIARLVPLAAAIH